MKNLNIKIEKRANMIELYIYIKKKALNKEKLIEKFLLIMFDLHKTISSSTLYQPDNF